MDGSRQRGRLLAALKHAFALGEQPLTPQEREWLDRLAARTVERGLAAPALFLLQSAKPVGFLGSQLLVFFRPLITLVAPADQCDRVASLLARRGAVEALMEMIEQRDSSARAGR